jgi:hypothetical protein
MGGILWGSRMVETDQLGTAISRDRSSLLMALLRRHAGVDEARLDVSMTKVILYEVDRLARVKQVSPI